MTVMERIVMNELHRRQCQSVPFNSGRFAGESLVPKIYMRTLHQYRP